jgi:hypothetical protein
MLKDREFDVDFIDMFFLRQAFAVFFCSSKSIGCHKNITCSAVY